MEGHYPTSIPSRVALHAWTRHLQRELVEGALSGGLGLRTRDMRRASGDFGALADALLLAAREPGRYDDIAALVGYIDNDLANWVTAGGRVSAVLPACLTGRAS